ncbi:MAG: metal-dependent transcriptional regulator [Thermoplasmata archaeon]
MKFLYTTGDESRNSSYKNRKGRPPGSISIKKRNSGLSTSSPLPSADSLNDKIDGGKEKKSSVDRNESRNNNMAEKNSGLSQQNSPNPKGLAYLESSDDLMLSTQADKNKMSSKSLSCREKKTRIDIKRYLKAMLEIESNINYSGRWIKNRVLAEYMNTSCAAVSYIFKKLERRGYVKYHHYKGAVLTESGRHYAISEEKNPATLEKFLRFIGVSRNNAEKDSRAISSAVSAQTWDRLLEFVVSVSDSVLLKDFMLKSQTPSVRAEDLNNECLESKKNCNVALVENKSENETDVSKIGDGKIENSKTTSAEGDVIS